MGALRNALMHKYQLQLPKIYEQQRIELLVDFNDTRSLLLLMIASTLRLFLAE